MIKINYKLLIVIYFLCFIFLPVNYANAALNTPLSDKNVGDIVNYSGYQWLVLDPSTGYLMLNGIIDTRPFDPDNTNIFNPNDPNNIGYWLNNTFYNSLTNKEWIIDWNWEFNMYPSDPYVGHIAKICLPSRNECFTFSDKIINSGIGLFWTRTMAESSYEVWGFSSNIRECDTIRIQALYSYGIRPALHLKQGLYIYDGRVTDNKGSIFINELPNEIWTSLNNINDAKLSADTAKEAAINAKDTARDALDRADDAANFTWYDGSSLAGNERSVADIAAYIRNTQLPGLETTVNTVKDIAEVTKSQTIYNGQSSAYWSYLAAQNAGDNMPPTLECGWQNGATITNTNRQATLWASATDNVSNPSSITLAYSLDGNNYTTFTGTATITFPSSPKYRTVYVRATDEAGKQTVKTLNIFVR